MDDLLGELLILVLAGLVGALGRWLKEGSRRETRAPEPPPGSRPVAFPLDPWPVAPPARPAGGPKPGGMGRSPASGQDRSGGGRGPEGMPGRGPEPGMSPGEGPGEGPEPGEPLGAGVEREVEAIAREAEEIRKEAEQLARGVVPLGDRGGAQPTLAEPGSGSGVSAPAAAAGRPQARLALSARLPAGRAELARAVVLAEVLGPPRALRAYRYGYGAGGAARGPLPGPAWAPQVGRSRAGARPEAGG